MLESQTFALRLSELRSKINASTDETKVEDLDAWTTDHRETEIRYRAAIVKEADDDNKPPILSGARFPSASKSGNICRKRLQGSP